LLQATGPVAARQVGVRPVFLDLQIFQAVRAVKNTTVLGVRRRGRLWNLSDMLGIIFSLREFLSDPSPNNMELPSLSTAAPTCGSSIAHWQKQWLALNLLSATP